MSVRLIFLVSVVAGLLVGCGTEDPPSAPETQVAERTPTTSGGVTDGRLGGAVFSGSDRGKQVLARGGSLDPRPGSNGGTGQGVADAGSCPGAPSGVPAEADLPAVSQVTLCLINAERQERGLVALVANDDLARAAREHSAEMVAKTYFAHESPSGTQPEDRIREAGYLPSSGQWLTGENLAWGSGGLAEPLAIHNSWMNSQGHRENILRPQFREIGVGIVVGSPRGGPGALTYATTFGAVEAAGGGGGGSSSSPASSASPESGATTTRRKCRKRRANKRCRRASASKQR